MKTVKIVPERVREYAQQTGRKCDRCDGRASGWPHDHHNANEIEIRASIGDVWDGNDHRSHMGADLCPRCWDLARYALAAIGVKFWAYEGDDSEPHEVES